MFNQKVNQSFKNLNETDLYITSIINKEFKNIPDYGIEDLAKKCNTSRTSVLRLAKKLGFSGYSEMKNYIKWESDNSSQLRKEDMTLSEEIEFTTKLMDSNSQIDEIIKKIKESKRIFLYGSGEAQRNCTSEMQRLFMLAGEIMMAINASSEFELLSKELNEDDLVFIISLSGDTNKFDKSLMNLKVSNTPIVSITNIDNNELSRKVDYRMYAATNPILINGKNVHNSFVSYFVVIEKLFRRYIETI